MASISEYETQISQVDKFLESIRDTLGTNVQADTRSALEADQRNLEQYRRALLNAIQAIRVLMDAGYPNIPPPTTSPAISEDIHNQATSLDTADLRYAVAQATTFNVTFSPPYLKE